MKNRLKVARDVPDKTGEGSKDRRPLPPSLLFVVFPFTNDGKFIYLLDE